MDINQLPAECISSILAFTSPKDACRSPVVSPTFKYAADSDALWTTFLPSDYRQIISQASSSSTSSFLDSLPKKDLYFRLCDHLLFIGSGNSSFVLEKESGRKCYMIGARDLDIIWGNSPQYWTWKSFPTSRYPEVAELQVVWWLEIKGKIEARSLSPKTKYAAYFVFKLVGDRYSRHGFQIRPVSLEVHFEGAEVEENGTKRVILDPPEGSLVVCEERSDGWMEVEMGEIFNELGDDGTIIFHLKQIDNFISKGGLIVEGIDIRPKYD
ncbi:putative F-box protein PP2-B12 [Cucumis melo var. makuwa]|uniref:F-box protein PP2-B12 n=2 Tax=Cucumis melo TaxID=3656 RepID=A0A5A7U6B1_CUCMM|nr:putative F-box protein PP2-B12 [Cucumis melo var. makuwa]TYK17399.1 putative F-box protein PP2-B12 [Cucumis melo var. makuwa]